MRKDKITLARKYIWAIIPAFILSFIASLSFLFLSTYIHEIAHIRAAEEQGIKMNIKFINYLPNSSNFRSWGKGGAEPISNKECENFNNLSLEKKQSITHAGVHAQIILFLPMLLISLFFLLIYGKKIFKKSLFWFSFFSLMLVLLLSMIITTLTSNVFSSNSTIDWNILSLNCSAIGS